LYAARIFFAFDMLRKTFDRQQGGRYTETAKNAAMYRRS
jgi:hypothetical protein